MVKREAMMPVSVKPEWKITDAGDHVAVSLFTFCFIAGLAEHSPHRQGIQHGPAPRRRMVQRAAAAVL
jgi:hypothetical protein